MDLIEIASKINQFENDFEAFKKKLEITEQKLTAEFSQNFEVKSLENDSLNERDEFIHFLRTGEMKSENLINFKARKGNFESGIPVSSNSSSLISYNLEKLSVMRKLCKFQSISSDSFDVIIEENGGKASWGTPNEKEPFVKKFIKTHELVAEPKATSKLIEDVRIDVEKFMSDKIAESFAIAEDEGFLLGLGVESPRGILSLENGKNANSIEQINSDLSTSSLSNLVDNLNPFYGQKTAFLMNKEIENFIKSLKDESGKHIWHGKLLEGENNTIFGIPVFISNFMPSSKIIFGNFEKGYMIVEKAGNYVMRDPYTQRPFVKFYTSKKIGGDVVDGNAFKILQIKA